MRVDLGEGLRRARGVEALDRTRHHGLGLGRHAAFGRLLLRPINADAEDVSAVAHHPARLGLDLPVIVVAPVIVHPVTFGCRLGDDRRPELFPLGVLEGRDIRAYELWVAGMGDGHAIRLDDEDVEVLVVEGGVLRVDRREGLLCAVGIKALDCPGDHGLGLGRRAAFGRRRVPRWDYDRGQHGDERHRGGRARAREPHPTIFRTPRDMRATVMPPSSRAWARVSISPWPWAPARSCA